MTQFRITLADLRERQKWPLNQKIDHTCGAIEAFINYCKEHDRTPYVSFSGGLNSTVLLELARRFIDHNMLGVFDNTGNEYPEIIRFVKQTPNIVIIRPQMTPRQVLERYGFPLVSKEQSQGIYQVRHSKSERTRQRRLEGGKVRSATIAQKWRYLIAEPYEVSPLCCDMLKKRPFHRYDRETQSLGMVGTMTEESDLRQVQYLRRGGCNSFSEDVSKSKGFPLSVWLEEDCWNYIRKMNVPYSPIYDVPGIRRTGCMFCGFGAQFKSDRRYRILYDRYPTIYRHVLNYTNNGYTLGYALRRMGLELPDECPTLF
ncbi:phosphoadenosine phosphosulfate reductase family protein [uncultured Alistipes sp.]|uniref:phosphoadenosine phosphosulfate reductase domain-containing protein n=1 Tax=uncultured Alistipes sp. TaxID=538949 RepID=UPI00258C03EE|nr:phosphoadenosine phosphosulfate reductase family protein [uncultured Alistipes sp.]